jgi:hypothetical protein
MKYLLTILFLLLTTPSEAQTKMVLVDLGPNLSLSTIITHISSPLSLEIRAFASIPLKTLSIQGNGKTIASCLSQTCDVYWQATSMNVGSNQLVITANGTSGQVISDVIIVAKPH